jgi:hypothetical protein
LFSPFPFQDVHGFYFDTFLILILHKCILIFCVLLYLKSVYKFLCGFHFKEFFFFPCKLIMFSCCLRCLQWTCHNCQWVLDISLFSMWMFFGFVNIILSLQSLALVFFMTIISLNSNPQFSNLYPQKMWKIIIMWIKLFFLGGVGCENALGSNNGKLWWATQYGSL